jgi:dihydroxy-acid dehydratase
MRSSIWFNGDTETSLSHRVALRSIGVEIDSDNKKPIIGIADSSSDLNPCNLPLRSLIDQVKKGVIEAGGIPLAFPVTSLGEDLMKPSAMLYRNLLSIEVEENLRSYPIDGVVLLANCDKSVPGALMGAFSSNLPTIMLVAGARPIATFKGKRIGTGTDLWRKWQEYRSGKISKAEWSEFESCLNCGLGSCNTMGTASSVALMVEALGFALPGTSSIPSGSEERKEVAIETGKTIVNMVNKDLTPSKIITQASFKNAIRTLNAIGGSTNAIIHLQALSGRCNGGMYPELINEIAETTPVIANIEPSGSLLIQDFNEAGGLPVVINELKDLFELDALTVTGKSWAEVIKDSKLVNDAIRSRSNALRQTGAFAWLTGNLALNGCLLKVSAASKDLFEHTGPALVFDDYSDMLSKIDDPNLPVNSNTVLILRNCGAVGVPGMPEWGMIPIPKKLLAEGITDMIRITDARMSGTSFGTCILHVSPESAVGGNLALVNNGDLIEVSVNKKSLNILISDEELTQRRKSWQKPKSEHLRGWPALYQKHVTQPDQGCDLDFLQASSPEARRFIPPVVGRS